MMAKYCKVMSSASEGSVRGSSFLDAQTQGLRGTTLTSFSASLCLRVSFSSSFSLASLLPLADLSPGRLQGLLHDGLLRRLQPDHRRAAASPCSTGRLEHLRRRV